MSQGGHEDEGLSIGELSERTGCPIETIRYYERVGVLRGPPRTASGRRVYGREHMRHLSIIRRARDLGFSLEHAKRLLRMTEQPAAPAGEARALTAAHLDELRQKIATLQQVEDRLRALVQSCPPDGGSDCPILDWLNGAAPPAAPG